MGSSPTLGANENAEVTELADAQDLKSCEPQIRTGSSPVFGIYGRRGIEQLVARRAHNPEVVGSNPAPATKTIIKCPH